MAVQKERTDFFCESIGDGVFRLSEFDLGNCYLLIGTERALLVDTGTGVGNLGKVVRQLTELPVDVVATHGHVDHVGGRRWFPSLYLHPDDRKMCSRVTRFYRRALLFIQPNRKKFHLRLGDVKKGAYRTRTHSVREGDVFDLGGKTVEVFHVPGHTLGSLCLRAREDRLLFAGDNVCPCLWLFLPHCTTVERWLDGARRTLELAQDCRMYSGHGEGLVTPEEVSGLIHVGEILLRETRKNQFFSRLKIKTDEQKQQYLVYRSGHVLERKKKTGNPQGSAPKSRTAPEITR